MSDVHIINDRLLQFKSGTATPSVAAVVSMRQELADRVRMPEKGERLSGPIPYSLTHADFKEGAAGTDRLRRRLEDESDLMNSYWGWHGIVEPEYDMLEPYTILDTESLMLRALKRKHNLMFRNGYAFTSLRPNLADYVESRIKQISYVMRMSFENLLKDIIWHLLVCSNVFLVKVRDEDMSGGKSSEKNGHRTPVAGYQLLPAHNLFPFLDGKGHIKHWRRFFGNGRPYKDYAPEDVIHFFWDRKPGHIFGTPRVTSVRDDIFALRRIEENTELLLITHMFPLTHIKVGTPEAPCQYLPDGTSEIDMYRTYIQNMPKEGVLITDERVDVDVSGAAGQGVDPGPLREHYKTRVYIGFGVSPIDMGEADEANKSSADNVSQNLKDDAKADLRWLCEQMKYSMILEWFEEAPFKVSVQNAVSEVNLEFHELDRDSQIAMESHHLNMFNNHAINHDELRQRIKSRPYGDEDQKKSHFDKHVMSIEKHRSSTQKELLRQKTNADILVSQAQAKADEKLMKTQIKLTAAQAKLEGQKAKTHEARAKAQASAPAGSTAKKKKSSGGRSVTTGRSSRNNPMKKASPKAKVTTNKVQPRNQHGVNLDPHKAKSSLEFELIHDGLRTAMRALGPGDDWRRVSREFLEGLDTIPNDQLDTVHDFVSRASDEDLLYVYLRSVL